MGGFPSKEEKAQQGGPRWWQSKKVSSSDSKQVRKKLEEAGVVPCVGSSSSETEKGGEARSPQGSPQAAAGNCLLPSKKQEEGKAEIKSPKEDKGDEPRTAGVSVFTVEKGGYEEDEKTKNK